MIRSARAASSLVVCGLVVTVGMVALAVPSQATASKFRIRLVETTKVLHPKEAGDIYAGIKAGKWCTVDFTSTRYPKRVVREKPFKASTGVVDIGFRVKANAAGGTWKFEIGCATTSADARVGQFIAVKRSHLTISDAAAGARGAIASVLQVASIGTMPAGSEGKGSDSFPAEGTVLIPGSQWFGGNGVDVMSSGSTGSSTSVWQCVELVKRFMNQKFGVPLKAYGNANQYWNNSLLTPYVDQHDNGSGYQPVPGDIVVDTAGRYGHVQIVDSDSGGTLTLVDQNSSPTGWATATLQGNGLWKRSNGDTSIHFLHIKANGSANPVTPTNPPTTTSAPSSTTYAETTGSVANTWTNYQSAGGNAGATIAKNATVQIACRVTGFKVGDGNTWWYQIASAPWSGSYYVSADAFYNNGATSGSLAGTPWVDSAVPDCSSGGGGGVTEQTWAETTGSTANTWTNYQSAGGTQGATISKNETVQIACKLTGFKVADGNTWWYRIASSPWNNSYYVSADAFYNDGATAGSLSGTPWVDSAVPSC